MTRPIATLMMLAGLGGCATVPNLGARPEPAQPGAFASARSLAGTSQNWPTDSWWEEFGDPQLDGLASKALKARREHTRPLTLTPEDRAAVVTLGKDLDAVWSAPTTTDRDRKELLRMLLEEVIMTIDRENFNAHLTLRWRGGLLSELDVPLPRADIAQVRQEYPQLLTFAGWLKKYSDEH